jgi:hypothetical protein
MDPNTALEATCPPKNQSPVILPNRKSRKKVLGWSWIHIDTTSPSITKHSPCGNAIQAGLVRPRISGYDVLEEAACSAVLASLASMKGMEASRGWHGDRNSTLW